MFETDHEFVSNVYLESVDFHTEKKDRRLLGVFRLVYIEETETAKRRITIPRATIVLADPVDVIHIKVAHTPFDFDYDGLPYARPAVKVDLFGTVLRCGYDDEERPFIVEDIPKPKKMTVEEIEKALGYKVEIISNE